MPVQLMRTEPIICKPDTKIYICCPAGNATGGPEALHQLAHHLNELGFNAFMYYYATPDSVGIVHENYIRYNVPYVTHLENESKHVLIMPETYLSPIFKRKYSQIRKVIWWLSVINYYKTQKPGINDLTPRGLPGLFKKIKARKSATFEKLKELNVMNIAHSYYSLAHLKEKGIQPVGQISDFMNDVFFEWAEKAVKKEDIVIYNPKKNDEYLDEIIKRTPALFWKPLGGMSPAEVAGWMSRAKVYVDFGYHPGKERMPREACIMRCCMVIGKSGSAAYAEDMPIPEKFRFRKNSDEIRGVIACIIDCLENYDKTVKEFEPYRQKLFNEKKQFVADIKKIFIKC